MNGFLKRLSEPSTYAGLAAMSIVAGDVFKIDEAPAVGEAINTVGQGVASGMPLWQAGALGAFGLLSIFMREKGDK